MRVFFYILLTFVSLQSLAAAPPGTCGNMKTKSGTFHYCVFTPKNSERAADVLYYLHPMGSNEYSWATDWKKQMENLWGPSRVPTVVAISIWKIDLFNEPNSANDRSGHLEFVPNEIIPAVEQSLLKRVPKQRMVVGFSQGGFNATALMLRHGNLFARVGMMCPGYFDINPYASDNEIADYVNRTGASKDSVTGMFEWIKLFYPTAQDWDNEAPLLTAPKYLNAKSPELFIADGEGDEFGFFQGAKKFFTIAQTQGVKVHFSDKMTGHCQNIDLTELANFLEP